MSDDAAPLVDEAAVTDRLADIDSRIGKLAERFDQLEFVIVEQFEPGMTDGGDLPSGNLRDRLDRIEAGLGHLRGRDPATPAPGTRRRRPTKSCSTPPWSRRGWTRSRHGWPSSPNSRASLRGRAWPKRRCPPRCARGTARRDRGRGAARHEALLAAVAARNGARGTTRSARRSATTRRRKDRPWLQLPPPPRRRSRARTLAGPIGSLLGIAAAERARRDARRTRPGDEPAAARPDLTLQHRGFAGFATALQTTLSQFETSVDSILARLDGMAQRLEAVEARIAAPPPTHARPSLGAIGARISLGALSEGIGALVQVLGRRPAARGPRTEAAMLASLARSSPPPSSRRARQPRRHRRNAARPAARRGRGRGGQHAPPDRVRVKISKCSPNLRRSRRSLRPASAREARLFKLGGPGGN
jgi:hypothetical protein